jgi:hypothetical protein
MLQANVDVLHVSQDQGKMKTRKENRPWFKLRPLADSIMAQ